MSEDLAKRVQQYVDVRDKLKQLNTEHEERIKPLLEIQEILAGRLQAALDANNAENIKTEHGTFYRSIRYSASLADPDVFMKFVIDNRKFDLLDRRANPTAVRAYVDAEKTLPPGCNLNAIHSVGVRRKPGSSGTSEASEA